MDEWHYQRGDSTFGPISGEVLHSLIKRKRVQEDTPVRRATESQWSTAIQVLPGLPPVPDSPPSSPEPVASGPHYDSSLPGASELYAPPQSTIRAAAELRRPLSLWLGVLLVLVAVLYKIASHLSMVFIRASWLNDASNWPDWLRLFATSLTNQLNFEHTILSLIACIGALIVWQGCAIGSLKQLYGDMVGRSRISGLWWFVPLANLIMPLLCWRDIRYFSRARREFPAPNAPFGPLLATWQGLFLLHLPVNLIFQTGARTLKQDADVSTFQVLLMLVRDFHGFALAIVIALVVLTNLRQQKRLYAHWNDRAYWDKLRHR